MTSPDFRAGLLRAAEIAYAETGHCCEDVAGKIRAEAEIKDEPIVSPQAQYMTLTQYYMTITGKSAAQIIADQPCATNEGPTRTIFPVSNAGPTVTNAAPQGATGKDSPSPAPKPELPAGPLSAVEEVTKISEFSCAETAWHDLTLRHAEELDRLRTRLSEAEGLLRASVSGNCTIMDVLRRDPSARLHRPMP